MAENLNLYVGCGLTYASQYFRHTVDSLKGKLRDEHGLYVFDFVGLENGTDEDVYRWDIDHCVATCDAFLSIHDYPGDGLGWETATAAARGIPILSTAHHNSRVSRLITGAAKVWPNITFARYDDMLRDVPALVIKHLVQIQPIDSQR